MTVYTPPLPTDVKVNPIRDRLTWERMRAACHADPGSFHGAIAARQLHWYHSERQAWLRQDAASGQWHGWSMSTAGSGAGSPEGVGSESIGSAVVEADWTPWSQALDDARAPYYRWFVGGRTNAAFNEVDRHVFAGHGHEVAFFYEGDRWDPAAGEGRGAPVHQQQLTRRELMLQSVLAALALQSLGLKAGDRIAINMPNILPQIVWTAAAKRLGIIYTAVFGGFSDKTLADRIANAGAKVVITADGATRNAENIPYKAVYSDPALSRYVPLPQALAAVEAGLAEANASTGHGRAVDGHGVWADVLVRELAGEFSEEITVSRAQVMRAVGVRLAASGVPATQAAQLRVAVAKALEMAKPAVERVVVVRHLRQQAKGPGPVADAGAGAEVGRQAAAQGPDLPWVAGRDVWADELLSEAQKTLCERVDHTIDELRELPDGSLAALLSEACPCVAVEANFPLFIIYTSGSTGKPKGVVHCHGGYLAGISETMAVSFDAVPGRDRMYVVADPGWITGQSYLISAALCTRIASVVTEGAPLFPHAGRFASIIERYGITIFKAGVTFLKSVMSNPQNRADVERYDLSSLRVATFCAEPTSPAVQRFGMELMTPQYINSYWATEHGGIVWTHFYGNGDMLLRSDTHCFPLPWVFGEVWRTEGEANGDGRYRYRRAAGDERGEIVITQPYPYLARTVWGDGERVGQPDWCGDVDRFAAIYFGRFCDEAGAPVWAYLQGDHAIQYSDGSFSFHGRSDDVINVSGHRMGTEEIEGAILRDKVQREDSPVGNCIVIGAPHREKGQTPLAFLQLAPGRELRAGDQARLAQLVREDKGAVAVPADFIAVSAFPETRSGKYMRRMLKAMLAGEGLGDTSTLRNPECLPDIAGKIDTWRAGQSLRDHQRVFEDGRFVRLHYQSLPGDGPSNSGEQSGLLATLEIRHPPVNSLSDRVIDELDRLLGYVERDERVRAVIVTGHGAGRFVAGADIRELLEDMESAEEVAALAAKAHGVFARLEQMAKPVIAAIDGAALGGGCELALACHYRVARAGVVIGQPEVNLFIPPGYGGTQRLPRLLMERASAASTSVPGDTAGAERAGLERALGMLLSGRSVAAEEAVAWGLIDELAPAGQDVLSFAKGLAAAACFDPGGASALVRAQRGRRDARVRWQVPAKVPLSIDDAAYVQACLAQGHAVGRRHVMDTIVTLVTTGLAEGIEAGYRKEQAAFAEAVMSDRGGRHGIALFMERQSPPLPLRPRPAWSEADRERALAAGELLAVGAPFYPGVTAKPRWQFAWCVDKAVDTGAPAHGAPTEAEAVAIIPVGQPEGNEVLLYVLASELNFNDVWAIMGIPISVFDLHDEDRHVTGSGALAMVAEVGAEVNRDGRLRCGDLVVVYSGQSELLSPQAGADPMRTRFRNQGYETPDGSHQQFMLAQAPQCLPLPRGLPLEQAGGFMLPAGTVYRCLKRSLAAQPGHGVLVEGAASGTGYWGLVMGKLWGLAPIGLVSNAERARVVEGLGGRAVERLDARWRDSFGKIPADPNAWPGWAQEGRGFVEAVAAAGDGRAPQYVISHAGETAFPRTYQAMATGGILSFFGASSGYHMTFMGKSGEWSAPAMFSAAKAEPGEAVLVHYGGDAVWDDFALAAIEEACARHLRVAVLAQTNSQADLVRSLGYGDAMAGVISLQELKAREPEFHWLETFPDLPDARHDLETFREIINALTRYTYKPVARAVQRVIGSVHIVVERAHQDSLAVSSMLVAPHTGRVCYGESMAGRRYSFYAPQVWNRQRNILMPGGSIHGTHMFNAAEAMAVVELLNRGLVDVPKVALLPWEQAAEAHQAIWDNRLLALTGGAPKAMLNHALPSAGILSRDELYLRWAADADDGSNGSSS